MKKILLAFLFISLLSKAVALEFGGGSISFQGNTVGCSIQVWKNDSNGWAGVQQLVNTPTSFGTGTAFWRGQVITPHVPMDEAAIATLCNVTDVNILRNVGAEGTFLTQEYLGIEFTAQDLNDGMYYTYEFALSGQNTTVGIVSKVPLNTSRPESIPLAGGIAMFFLLSILGLFTIYSKKVRL